jgi:hypothetical protein
MVSNNGPLVYTASISLLPKFAPGAIRQTVASFRQNQKIKRYGTFGRTYFLILSLIPHRRLYPFMLAGLGALPVCKLFKLFQNRGAFVL